MSTKQACIFLKGASKRVSQIPFPCSITPSVSWPQSAASLDLKWRLFQYSDCSVRFLWHKRSCSYGSSNVTWFQVDGKRGQKLFSLGWGRANFCGRQFQVSVLVTIIYEICTHTHKLKNAAISCHYCKHVYVYVVLCIIFIIYNLIIIIICVIYLENLWEIMNILLVQ